MAPPVLEVEDVAAVELEAWESKLAYEAASALSSSLAHREPKEIVEQLLARLRKEKRTRQIQGLNHWPEYAPAFLRKVIHGLRNQEAWRRRRIAAFFNSDYLKACTLAERALGSREEAEDVVCEAFVRLQLDKTAFAVFNRTVRDICVNRLRRRGVERRLFVSSDSVSSSSEALEAADFSTPEPSSKVGDPELLLMDLRFRRAKPLMVGRAKKTKKFRRARRSQWTLELAKACPKPTASNG